MRWFYIILSILFSNIVIAQFENASLKVMYDSVWEYKNLQLIPIKFDWIGSGNKMFSKTSFNAINLQQAIKEKKISVSEIYTDEGSDARVVVVKNKSKENILINNGDIIMGGKQDRIIAETKLIKPGKEEHYLDVYCGEKGRWDKRAKKFKYYKQADYRLKKTVDLQKNQNEIWKEIDKKFKSKNKHSKSWSVAELEENFINADSNYLHYFINEFKKSDSAFSGFIAITGNRIIGCDLYANADLQMLQFFSNVSSYTHEAIETGNKPNVSKSAIEQFIRPILSDYKTRDAFLQNRGKVFKTDDKIIHISVYGN